MFVPQGSILVKQAISTSEAILGVKIPIIVSGGVGDKALRILEAAFALSGNAASLACVQTCLRPHGVPEALDLTPKASRFCLRPLML